MEKNKKEKCKVCDALTSTVFNINFNAVHVCEDCAYSIFIQQAVWYTKQQIPQYP